MQKYRLFILTIIYSFVTIISINNYAHAGEILDKIRKTQ
jgi:hypothetical protein